MGRNILKGLKLVLVTRPIELGVIVYQVMPKIPGVTVRTGKRSNASYIRINPMAASGSGYYIYATNLSWILIPGYCLRVYIWIGGNLSSSE